MASKRRLTLDVPGGTPETAGETPTLPVCTGRAGNRRNILPRGLSALLLAILLTAIPTNAQEKSATVSGVSGVKQDAVDRFKSITKGLPPPPPAGSVTSAAAGAVGSAAKIQAVQGVGGIDTAKLRNLEIAIQMRESAAAPAGNGAEKGGKGKAAAAALLSAPLEKAPKLAPKQDGRAGFQEFEKLQNRGS